MQPTKQGEAILDDVKRGKTIRRATPAFRDDFIEKPSEDSGGGRLFYLDNLRWVLIAQVLMLHLAETYGPVGNWYYLENAGTDWLGPLTSRIFIFFCESTHAFRMGILFFIAGYFVPRAYDRKGGRRFIIGRLKRLGIPALVFMLLVQPLIAVLLRHYLHGDPAGVIREYPHYILSLQFLSCSGPLWFAMALLIFSLGYVGVRAADEQLAENGTISMGGAPPLTHGAVAKLILGVAAVTFLVRTVQPIGASVMNMQLCFFAKYIALFILGALAYRRDMLARIPYRFGMTWFTVALAIGVPWLLAMELQPHNSLINFYGGWHWPAALYALWETFFCTGVGLGMLVLFRDYCNWQGRLTGFLSRNSFGVFIIHTPLMVWLTLAARHIHCHPLLKFGVSSAVFIPLCFAVSALIRKIPLCARFLS